MFEQVSIGESSGSADVASTAGLETGATFQADIHSCDRDSSYQRIYAFHAMTIE